MDSAEFYSFSLHWAPLATIIGVLVLTIGLIVVASQLGDLHQQLSTRSREIEEKLDLLRECAFELRTMKADISELRFSAQHTKDYLYVALRKFYLPNKEEIDKSNKESAKEKAEQRNEIAKRAAEKREPTLQAIRDNVIAAGLATPETVDSVIYAMSVDEFQKFQMDNVSRVDFKPRANDGSGDQQSPLPAGESTVSPAAL